MWVSTAGRSPRRLDERIRLEAAGGGVRLAKTQRDSGRNTQMGERMVRHVFTLVVRGGSASEARQVNRGETPEVFIFQLISCFILVGGVWPRF